MENLLDIFNWIKLYLSCMNKLITLIVVIVLIFGLTGFVDFAEANVRVRGHFRPSTGQFIMPHHRTRPNNTRLDNWSTRGNFNPHTGRRGTVDPFRDSWHRW